MSASVTVWQGLLEWTHPVWKAEKLDTPAPSVALCMLGLMQANTPTYPPRWWQLLQRIALRWIWVSHAQRLYGDDMFLSQWFRTKVIRISNRTVMYRVELKFKYSAHLNCQKNGIRQDLLWFPSPVYGHSANRLWTGVTRFFGQYLFFYIFHVLVCNGRYLMFSNQHDLWRPFLHAHPHTT